MRRLLVILGLLATGTAAVTVPSNPGPPGLPPAADAVLNEVRAVISPVAPPGVDNLPVPVSPPSPAAMAPPTSPTAAPAEPRGSAPKPEPGPARSAPDDASGRCERIKVSQKVEPRSVAPGGRSKVTVTLYNEPGNRRLSRLSLVERISGTKGVAFTVESSEPKWSSNTTGGIFFDNLGEVESNGTKEVTINLVIEPESATGNLITEADATGDCVMGPGQGTRAVEGRNTLNEPAVSRGSLVPLDSVPARPPTGQAAGAAPAAAGPATGGLLSRTGGLFGFGLACWMVAAGMTLRSLSARRPAQGRPVRWKSWRKGLRTTTRQAG